MPVGLAHARRGAEHRPRQDDRRVGQRATLGVRDAGRERVEQRVLVLLGRVGRGPPHAEVGPGAEEVEPEPGRGGLAVARDGLLDRRHASRDGARASSPRTAPAATAARTWPSRACSSFETGRDPSRRRSGTRSSHLPDEREVQAGRGRRAPAAPRRTRRGAPWRTGRPHGTGPSARRPTSRMRVAAVRSSGIRVRSAGRGGGAVLVHASHACNGGSRYRLTIMPNEPLERDRDSRQPHARPLRAIGRLVGWPPAPGRRAAQARGRGRRRRGARRPDARRHRRVRVAQPQPGRRRRGRRDPRARPMPRRPSRRRSATAEATEPPPAATEAPAASVAPAPIRRRPRRPSGVVPAKRLQKAIDEFRAKTGHPRHLRRDRLGRRADAGPAPPASATWAASCRWPPARRSRSRPCPRRSPRPSSCSSSTRARSTSTRRPRATCRRTASTSGSPSGCSWTTAAACPTSSPTGRSTGRSRRTRTRPGRRRGPGSTCPRCVPSRARSTTTRTRTTCSSASSWST